MVNFELIEIKFYDHLTGNLIYATSGASVTGLKYSRVLNGIGKVAMVLQYDSWVVDAIKLDNIVEITRYNQAAGARQVEETYLIQSWQLQRDDDTRIDTIVIGGLSLNHFLARRHIIPTDDALGAGGYVTRAGEASEVMYDFARYQIGANAPIDRRLAELITISYSGEGENAGGRYNYKAKLFKVFEELAIRGKVDFQISRIDGNNLRLDIARIGTDRTYANLKADALVFSPDLGNLLKVKYREDHEKEMNYVYALGEGKDGNRPILEYPDDAAISESNWNRREQVESVTKQQSAGSLYLLTGAIKALYKKRAIKELSFDIPSDGTGAAYNQDWFLGDDVSVVYRQFTGNFRITEINNTIVGNQEDISVTTAKEEILVAS